MPAALDPAQYALGAAGLAASLGSAGWGSWWARSALLPDWGGARARLAETVIALSLVLGVAQLLGAVRLLRPVPVGLAEVAAGLAVAVLARRSGRGRAPASPQAGRRPPRIELLLGSGAVFVVVSQWLSHAARAINGGMTHPDTLWYQMPYAAQFAQTHGFPRLEDFGNAGAQWYPFDGQLVHTLLFLPFSRDWLSPFVTVGWAALALLAAWCIGSRRGAGHLSVAGAAVVLGLPMLAGTQPGQASTDIACGALFLAALALLLESELATVPLALAGAATGLAISTKVTLAVPIVVLVVLVCVLCLVQRRGRAAAAWIGGLAATGSFWFFRNWILSGNPLPWFAIPLGPLRLDRVVGSQGASIIQAGLFDGSAWSHTYLPGLHQAAGILWPLVMLLTIGGSVLMLAHRGKPLDQVVGIAGLSGVLGYLMTPTTAGIGFAFNLRYISPALLLGAAVLPLSLPATRRWRLGQAAVSAALVAIGATARNRERVPAWPSEAFVAVPLAVVALVIVVVAARAVVAGRVRPAPLLVCGALILAAGGWTVQRHYGDHRYVDAGVPPTDLVPRFFRDVHDARVVLFGSVESYPLFGTDLSNRVRLGRAVRVRAPADLCRAWRSALGDHFDYIVTISGFGFGSVVHPPTEVIASDPAVTVKVQTRGNVIYQVRGRMHPELCAGH